MVTTLEEYFPFATGTGSNVTELQWREMADSWLPTGIVRGALNELAVAQRAAGANASVDVATGEAVSNGQRGRSTTLKNVGITANATGNPRIDLIVIRFDWVNDNIVLDVLTGTAAATPAAPALTQDLTTKWEEPLAEIDVASGFSSIVTANIRDRRQFTRTFRYLAAKEPCRVASSAVPASTVVGTTRTANANGALGNLDGVAVAAGDRVLDLTTGASSGPWLITDTGSAARPWIMVRPRDFDTSSKVRAGTLIAVGPEGSATPNKLYQLTTADAITLGSTSMSWAAAGGIASSTLSAKGSIISASAASTPAELTVGADFTILRARAAAGTMGLEWGTLATSSTVATTQTTTSTSYADLATPGPAVTLTTGTAVLVIMHCNSYLDTANAVYMSVAVSGATTIAASDTRICGQIQNLANAPIIRSAIFHITGLTAGSNTFTAKYRVGTGTGTWGDRSIILIPV